MWVVWSSEQVVLYCFWQWSVDAWYWHTCNGRALNTSVYMLCVFDCLNRMNCIFNFAFIVCSLCRPDIWMFKVAPHLSVFCVVFNQQVNIKLLHLHIQGVFVIIRYELLHTSQQQLDSEVTLKHKEDNISWERKSINLKEQSFLCVLLSSLCLSSYIRVPLILYFSRFSHRCLNTPLLWQAFIPLYVCKWNWMLREIVQSSFRLNYKIWIQVTWNSVSVFLLGLKTYWGDRRMF